MSTNLSPPRPSGHRGAVRRARRLCGLLMAGTTALVWSASTGTASAAVCAPMSLGTGAEVTALNGAECIAVGNGETLIKDPTLTTNKVVKLTGGWMLNQAKTELRPDSVDVRTLSLVTSSGTNLELMLSADMRVGIHRMCDLEAKSPGDLTNATKLLSLFSAEDTALGASGVLFPTEVNCRDELSVKVTLPNLKLVTSALGMKLGVLDRPMLLGVDDLKGGRLFGTMSLELPSPPFPKSPNVGIKSRIAVTAEISRDNGAQVIGGGFAYQKSFLLGPGVKLVNPAFSLNTATNSVAGSALIATPGGLGVGASVAIENGSLKTLEGVVTPPMPIPIGVTGISVVSMGLGFKAGVANFPLPTGGTVTTSNQYSGSARFAGPSLTVGGKTFTAIDAPVTATVSADSLSLRGDLRVMNGVLTFGGARALVKFRDPFRFEAEAAFGGFSIRGRAFLGYSGAGRHFTALGDATVRVPSPVPIVGGQELGGFQVVASDKATAATVFVDPPIIKPRTIGVAFKYQGGFDIIDSTEPFITVQPSGSITTLARDRVVRSKGPGLSFVAPAGGKDLVVDIYAKNGKAPRNVRVVGPSGAPLKVSTSVGRKVTSVSIAKAQGRIRVLSSSRLARLAISAIEPAPYLDPLPGYGTRPQGAVTAGAPTKVCWKVKHAPKGAKVDLFEDQNGFAATGRVLASDLPTAGCFDIPTKGLEPGRHWAYGLLKGANGTPISFRYWPVGIDIVDPTALAAPANLSATPTADGAAVTFAPVTDATGYVVTARPKVSDHAEEVKAILDADTTSTQLSLRGARDWTVTVQALGADDRIGNFAAPVSVSPTSPVVLAGRPHGLPQVGQPWAFKLDTANLAKINLIKAPKGTQIDQATGLLTWTPSEKAGRGEPLELTIEGCHADGRCVTRTFHLSAYMPNITPVGAARGFQVLGSFVKPGGTLEIRAQGIDEKPTVTIDGKVVPSRILDESTVLATIPAGLAKGGHTVGLQIGGDLTETQSNAIVVR